MKLFLDFHPCKECHTMIEDLSSTEFMYADEQTRADESAKFLRHLTYNHTEVVRAIVKEIKVQKRSPEFDLYK